MGVSRQVTVGVHAILLQQSYLGPLLCSSLHALRCPLCRRLERKLLKYLQLTFLEIFTT